MQTNVKNRYIAYNLRKEKLIFPFLCVKITH